MKKIKSKLENQTIKVIQRCTNLWLVLYTSFTGIGILCGPQDKTFQFVVLLIGLLLGIVIFFFGREYIIQITLHFINAFSSIEKKLCGTWEILIDYTENNIDTGRRGTVLIEKSASGLVLRGDRIYDRDTETDVVEKWVSDYVNLSEDREIQVLQYGFRIRRPDDKKDEFSKVGTVVLKSEESGEAMIFKGEYVDLWIPQFGVNDSERLRKGSVILRRGTS